MATRRLLVDTLLAVALVICFAAIGWLVADPVLASFGSVVPGGKLIATSPLEPTVYRVKLAAASGAIPLGAWCVAFVYRIHPGKVPGPGMLALFASVPTLAAVAGMAARWMWLRWALQALARDAVSTAIQPMVTIGSLSIAGWGAMCGLVAAGVLGVVVVATRK